MKSIMNPRSIGAYVGAGAMAANQAVELANKALSAYNKGSRQVATLKRNVKKAFKSTRGKVVKRRRVTKSTPYKRKQKTALKRQVQAVINENVPQGRDIHNFVLTPMTLTPDVSRPVRVQTWAQYTFHDYNNVMPELKELWNEIATTPAIEAAILKENVIIPYWNESRTFMNPGQLKLYVTFYLCAPVSTTNVDPVTTLTSALNKIRQNSNMTIQDEGFTPSQAQSFKQKWKTLETKTITLGPGKSYTFSKTKKNTNLDNNEVDLTSGNYVKNYVTVLMVKFQTEKTTDQNIIAPYNAYKMTARGHRDIKLQCPNAVSDQNTVEVLLTGRVSNSNYGGAGAAEIMKMDPLVISQKCADLGANVVIEKGT